MLHRFRKGLKHDSMHLASWVMQSAFQVGRSSHYADILPQKKGGTQGFLENVVFFGGVSAVWGERVENASAVNRLKKKKIGFIFWGVDGHFFSWGGSPPPKKDRLQETLGHVLPLDSEPSSYL